MDARARVAIGIAIVLALVGAGALAYGLRSRAPPTTTSDGSSPGACPNVIPFRMVPPNGGVASFVAENAPEGPHPIAGLRYQFEIAGNTGAAGNASQDAPPPRGSLSDAAAAGPESAVRYVDRAGSRDTVDPGDEVDLRANGSFTLSLYDASGKLVGGTWGCV